VRQRIGGLHVGEARIDDLDDRVNGRDRGGDIVTTGSWSGLRFAERRARVLAQFPGVGDVSLEFA
jgi:hypothetical protein